MTCPSSTEHGTLNAHRFHRCRCPQARLEHNRYRNQVRLDHLHGARRTVAATGTHRRLQALTAIGWTDEAIAAELNVTRGALYQLRRRALVYRTTAVRVSALYDRLRNTPGGSAAAERRAATAGWLAPKWWDTDTIDDPTHVPVTEDHPRHWTDVDPVAVARAMTGEQMPLTRAERLAAVARLEHRGMAQLDIARTLHIHPRQVLTDLTRIRLSPSASAAGPSTQKRTTA